MDETMGVEQIMRELDEAIYRRSPTLEETLADEIEWYKLVKGFAPTHVRCSKATLRQFFDEQMGYRRWAAPSRAVPGDVVFLWRGYIMRFVPDEAVPEGSFRPQRVFT